MKITNYSKTMVRLRPEDGYIIIDKSGRHYSEVITENEKISSFHEELIEESLNLNQTSRGNK